MTPVQKEKMTTWHLIFSNYGIPVIIGLCSANLWFVKNIYEEYKSFKKDTQEQLMEHETRIVVVETKLERR